ncbi:methyltransferase domain-containing protein [Streptomonospora wellingtoniae]|uniref:Methyltransferase domain-containing protein n=1 Tax=Streptomonospora wellingtoniae TaxID=3075544 RepID=A0ABU2L092_9ACTN|nr:methyltransferase domain-containing protein [Streptomonospora sp. DSM 45055]MDT0304753.1 methyltransferase domain-containing protein [Streptomonospora sp. DSM 45055]
MSDDHSPTGAAGTGATPTTGPPAPPHRRPGGGDDHGNGPSSGLRTRLDAFDDLPDAVALRRRSYQLLGLGAGDSVVDAGCGAGRAVGEIAAIIAGRGGSVVGIDLDEDMIATARLRCPEADFHVGDANALSLDDSSVTAYRADKVLHALTDPAAALAEAHRVLRPGGRIVLVGQEWDGCLVDAESRDLTLRITRAWADALPSPGSARAFPRLLRQVGFSRVEVEARCALFTGRAFLPPLIGAARAAVDSGAVAPADAQAWLEDQQRRMGSGNFLAAAPFILASARKP